MTRMHSIVLNLLLLLVTLVLVPPVSAKVFLSIDCGYSSSEFYTDEYSIEWVGDQQYIQTGESRNVNTENKFRNIWDTVREFTTRNKNCYSLDVFNNKSEDINKVERVLVRASFYYNNYDKQGTPPTFNLQFNGNHWSQVVTSMDYTTYEEVVVSLNHGNNISVCLAQTHRNHFPFITALEVRSLDTDMYSYVDSNYPLILKLRHRHGNDTILRYPEDSYDRIWGSDGPPSNTSGLTWFRSNLLSVKVNISDEIPEALFRTALTSLSSTGGIWVSSTLGNLSAPLHFNLYFTEAIRLNSTQKRSFNIKVRKIGDIGSRLYDTVIPPYGHVMQVRIENVTTGRDGHWMIEYIPTKDSTLPPLIYAYEGFIIGDKLVQGTNSDDVNSLALLQKSFIQLRDWKGDPCLPSPYSWDWVACDSDPDSPRIIALYLNNLRLAGTLPDFSVMDALETIDLHGNSLTQEIPEFLGTFPKLKVLNLADNNFSGAIPSSILNNNNLKLSVSGNPNLITNNKNTTQPRKPSSSSKNSMTSTIPIIIFGSAIFQMLDYIFGLLL